MHPLDHYSEILAACLRATQATVGRPFVIAVDGRSGSGKSTLARFLALRLEAALVSCDDFYCGGTEVLDASPAELAECCIDRNKLKSVVTDLANGRLAQFAPFDWQLFDGSLAKAITTVEPRPFVLIEGVYSFHPDFRPDIQFSILIEVDDEKRLQRLIAREGNITEWERQWQDAEDWYFQEIALKDEFSVIVPNNKSVPEHNS